MIPSDHFVRFYNEVFKFLDEKNGLEKYYLHISKHQELHCLELFTEKDISSNYKLPENERNKNLKTFLPSGYFEAGQDYRFTITPINFYGKKGKTFS